jgi:hypothetical protein
MLKIKLALPKVLDSLEAPPDVSFAENLVSFFLLKETAWKIGPIKK